MSLNLPCSIISELKKELTVTPRTSGPAENVHAGGNIYDERRKKKHLWEYGPRPRNEQICMRNSAGGRMKKISYKKSKFVSVYETW